MAAIKSLQTALRGIRTNPVLFLGGLILGLVVLPQTAAQLAQIPLLPLALQALTFFITPFIIAGIYGMADEAVESDTSRTSLSTLTDVGREKYVPLLLANVVELGITLPFVIIFIFLAIAGVFTLGISAAATGSGLALNGGVIVLLLFAGLLVLAYIIIMFFIQFFPVAVVVNDAGAIESFQQSYRFVWSNIVPTLGYSVIQVVAGIITALPVLGFVFFRTIQDFQTIQSTGGAATAGMPAGMGFSAVEIAAITLLSLAMQMLLTAFKTTYAVAFFEEHQSSPAEPTGPDIDGDSVIPQFE
ncbi:hypothetical protein E6P09_08585 [Haloferax mediterranei ATCC 33500]|uniref:DUF7847 domain-containing protein n=1 Tax=Haloferax mediterranei (strain ATCC 33500 / DSM 1411 / JCM 8866 / NBRC 14739 / NCIMB 2177 / R-4) TaxID=523841 RepID=I3R3L8_HALMT|nr:hypothetical protein [Haloferax mediterranei]AFK18828.1 hypothetical protein HFX_1112 [Haloferax mediterranei ATCC 33500]AHZ21806.1 hypothetical protein BM92_03655 [Haloferax mediterranei ATCC 33500]EMA03314.1 hypothetical protein C439_04930 [Haloferax mediterranei ATCC 33500]MDX5988921.1 hypothetical protein [Haloferax mediterranei ATCC 33500]QCQ76625.1 hypothetical protein E6P09_08585 [Haloferax mediterranei ATCC 33500]